MQRLKILAVSYAFPPMAYPRAVQVPRLLSSISASINIVCGISQGELSDETVMSDGLSKFNEVIRVPDVMSFNNFPDNQRSWAKAALCKLLKSRPFLDYRPDLFITFSMPVSDHLFGLEYKRRTGVPWIAHFSDPWCDNPYIRNNPLSRALNRRIERDVIKNADAVIFTSPETVKVVMQKYPRDWLKKAFHLPHCLDRKLYNYDLEAPSDVYIVRYIGNFYGIRSPRPFYEAIESVGRSDPDLFAKASFEIVGDLSRFDRLIDSFPFAKQVIKFFKTVPYSESIQLMRTAHCLFVVSEPLEFSIFFPSKLADYIGANRFIAGFAPDGAVARIINEVGGLVANPSDPNATSKLIRSVLVRRPDRLPLDTSQYDKDVVSKKIIDIIHKVLSEAGGMKA